MALAPRPVVGRRALLLRHGSRPGGVDPWLDPEGEREATNAAAYISTMDAGAIGSDGAVTAVYCSPFLRALQTALPIARALGLLIRVEFGFCELLAEAWLQNDNPLPALLQRQLRNLPAGFEVQIDHSYKTAVVPTWPEVIGKMRPGDAKQREQALHRHRRAIYAALEASGGGSVLIVAHGSTHDFVADALCPQEHDKAHHTGHFCVPHCAITEFVEQADGWHLRMYGRTPLDLGFVDVNEVIWLLKLGDPVVRCNALESLGQLGRSGDVRAVKPVVSCLKDKKASVRKAAVQALRDIVDGGDTVVLAAAREAVRRCECKLQRSALQVLGVTDRPLALLGLGPAGKGGGRRAQPAAAPAAAAAAVALAAGALLVAVWLRSRRSRAPTS